MQPRLSCAQPFSRSVLEILETRRLFAFGKTDTSFGDDGRAFATIKDARGTQQAVDLIVAGTKLIAGGDPGLVRFSGDGAIDNTFGNAGTVRIGGLSFKAVATDGAGSVFVLGRSASGTLVLKYSGAGVISTAFGTRGSALVTTGDTFRPVSLAAQGDGKIVVVGTLVNSKAGTAKVRVYRLNTDGTIDTAFGTAGIRDLQLGQAPLLTPDLHDVASGISVVGTKILVAGGSVSTSKSFSDPDGNFISGTFGDAIFAVARLNADGTLDGTYGTDGVSRSVYADADLVATYGFSDASNIRPTAVGFQGDGSVFLGSFDTAPVVARFVPNGNVAFTSRPDDGSPLSTPVDLVGLSGGRIGVLARGSYRTEYGFVIATIDGNGAFSNDVRTDDLDIATDDLNPFAAGSLASLNGRFLVGGQSNIGSKFAIAGYTPGTGSDPRPDDFANATINDIVKDNAGGLHLAYFKTNTKSLHYAYRAPNGLWNAAVEVDAKNNTGTYLSIALRTVNKGTEKAPIFVQEPSIAYFAGATGDLKLAESEDLGATFTLSVVAQKGSVGQYPTLLYDSKNRATISFYNRTTGDAVFSQLKNGAWGFETIDEVGDVGRDLVLTVNPQGSYAVAYFDATNKTVKYAVQGTKGRWATEVADSTKAGAKYISLAHSQDFGPAISYFDIGEEDLNFAYFRKGKWKRQNVATVGSPGLFSHVQFRFSFGNPTIFAWTSGPNRIEKYANIIPGPINQTVFNGGGQFLSVDYDGTEQDFAFLDTSSNQLHVRVGPGPD